MPPRKTNPENYFVLDTTARTRPRIHEIMVKGVMQNLEFKPGKPVELPFSIAIKFLKHEGFLRTDRNGTPVEWENIPKQPSELAAGERLALKPDQTVATLRELTDEALTMRALLLPGGDEIATRPDVDREQVEAFIIETATRLARENSSHDRAEDEFTPPPLADMDEAA